MVLTDSRKLSKNSTTSNERDQNSEVLSSNIQIFRNFPFMKKVPQDAEASNILVGEVDCLDHTLSAFIRLNTAVVLSDLTEVPLPTRFIFILLTSPSEKLGKYEKLSR